MTLLIVQMKFLLFLKKTFITLKKNIWITILKKVIHIAHLSHRIVEYMSLIYYEIHKNDRFG